MNLDHLTGGIGAYLGALTAHLIVSGKLASFIRKHLENIYPRLGRIEKELGISPQPFPDTDLKPEHISGIWGGK